MDSMLLRITKALLITAVLCFSITLSTSAQQGSPAKEWFKDQYSYINPALEIPADSLAKLERNWGRASNQQLSEAKRKKALQNLLETMVHLQDAQQRYNNSAISNLVRRYRELDGLSVPPSRQIDHARGKVSYHDVEPVGNGSRDIILLSDIFAGVSMYDSFIERNKHKYTFHPLNLPGMGETTPLPLPNRRNYTDAPWFSKIETAVADYAKRKSLENPVIVGMWGSGYLAVRLAVNHPDLFERAVVLNSPINSLLFHDPGNPTALSSVEDRIEYLKNEIPDLFPDANIEERRESARGMAGFYTSQNKHIPKLVYSQAKPSPKVVQQYVGELLAQDYEKDLGCLKIPLLSITALPESNGMRDSMGSQFINAEWEKAESKYTSAPLHHIVFKDTRMYIPIDVEQKLDTAVRGFLNGNIADGKEADFSNRGYQVSPRRHYEAMIGATAVEINYGSPSMRGRNIYGNLVRYGTPWRAGANNVTRITFGNDVEINGKKIPEGTYGFFVTPKKENPWELVFMEYTFGIGGLGFPYDPDYKFASFSVKPDSVRKEKHLRYFVKQQSQEDGVLGFTWAGKKLELQVRAPEGIGRAASYPLEKVKDMNWTVLAEEQESDGNYASRADAQKVSYSYDSRSDSLWFKIALQNEVSPANIGINLIVDQDQDQTTGSFWYGQSNSSFTYDRLGTVFVVQSLSGNYVGRVGVSDDEFIANNQFTHNIQNNFSLAVDSDRQEWYVGVPLEDIDPDGKFNLSIAVGGSRAWNDDIPNSGFININLD